MKDLVRSAVLVTSLLFASSAFAQHQTFTVDPNASQVAFALAGSGHHVSGTFHVQSGSIDFDRTAHTISGSVVVAAGSGNSGEPSRDKKMNNDVLDIAHYSESPSPRRNTTAPSRPPATPPSRSTVHSRCTARPMTLPCPCRSTSTAGLSTPKTHFIVPYVQWGLKDPSWGFLKVSKEVDIDLTLTGKVTPTS